eukprot:COSAG05_NODE_1593_length_4463_cov_18.956920_2_plen_338_part_00
MVLDLERAQRILRRVRWRRVAGFLTAVFFLHHVLPERVTVKPSDMTAAAEQVPKCPVPHIFHQTWKTREVGQVFEQRIRSWIKYNPAWEYKFWTDDDNRALIKEHFPTYLDMFDGYSSPIMRADAIRYFILYKYGGVYADLDFEALRPLEPYLKPETGVLLGQEPLAHARVLYDQPRMLCNAVMISCPGHPFWKAVLAELQSRYDQGIKTVRATGPRMLNDVVDKWARGGRTAGGWRQGEEPTWGKVEVAEPELFYPEFDSGNTRIAQTCNEQKCLECKGEWRKDGPLSPEQEAQCKVLGGQGYGNRPLDQIKKDPSSVRAALPCTQTPLLYYTIAL